MMALTNISEQKQKKNVYHAFIFYVVQIFVNETKVSPVSNLLPERVDITTREIYIQLTLVVILRVEHYQGKCISFTFCL